jgi:3D-(3,5/4)-trihydroxycyclohexane-1,2-dione acylhydrolase (decyclizing)
MPLAREADLVIAVGTRLQDFTTGSNSLFPQTRFWASTLWHWTRQEPMGTGLVADAALALAALDAALARLADRSAWTNKLPSCAPHWRARVDALTRATPAGLATCRTTPT